MRQAVHQIEVDAADAGRAQPVHRALDHRERLPAVDRPLHLRIDVLHAEACAIDADRRRAQSTVSRVRRRGSISTANSPRLRISNRWRRRSPKAPQIVREHHGRRAAAEMDMADRAPAAQSSADRGPALPGADPDIRRPADSGGRPWCGSRSTSRVLAERDVQVEREPGVTRQLGEPAAVVVRAVAGMEMRRRRIARVARHRAVVSWPRARRSCRNVWHRGQAAALIEIKLGRGGRPLRRRAAGAGGRPWS